MKKIFWVVWFIVFGIVFYNLLLWLPLFILGWATVPIAYVFRRTMISPYTGKRIVNAPRWLWIWGNDEDGILPRDDHFYTIEKRALGWSDFHIAYRWAAERNNVDNLKYVRYINPPNPIPQFPSVKLYSGRRLFVARWKGYVYMVLGTNTRNYYIGWRLKGHGFMSSSDRR